MSQEALQGQIVSEDLARIEWISEQINDPSTNNVEALVNLSRAQNLSH